MAVQKIKYYGSSVLERRAKEIRGMNQEIRTLVRDMFDTMHHHRGVGLAAPQIGVSKRMIVIDCGPDYQDDPLVLINPEITSAEGSQTGEEGCISFPELFLPVTRPMKITARFRTLAWKLVEVEAEGLLARAIAHECDHLDGKLFIDLVADRELVVHELTRLRQRIALLVGEHTPALAGAATL
jgi:peptide deformylase